MEVGTVEALALAAIFDTLGVPATVTRPAPDDTPIPTTAVWQTPLVEESGFDLTRREPLRIVALTRDAVPSVPRGTLIVAPERSGGADQRWRVEGPFRVDAYEARVIVVPDPEP